VARDTSRAGAVLLLDKPLNKLFSSSVNLSFAFFVTLIWHKFATKTQNILMQRYFKNVLLGTQKTRGNRGASGTCPLKHSFYGF
jgi:hypothetical protein